MNFSEIILEYLKQNGAAPIPGFGVFGLENTKAVISEDKNSILPPAKQIYFSTDYQLDDPALENFIASKKNCPTSEARAEIRSQTGYWKKLLMEGETLVLKNLGTFHHSAETVNFQGERIETQTPDFYGLEEIKLAEISPNNEYRTSRTSLWVGALLAVAALTAAGFFYREDIFGKDSFGGKLPAETNLPPKIIPAALPTPVDSLKTDSIKQDSLKKTAAITKWRPKKYTTKKWSKARKRRNH